MPANRHVWLAAAMLCAFTGLGEVAYGRSGLTWGNRGYNIFSNYAYTSVWGALMGAGVPHHSLDPPRLDLSPASSGSSGGYSGLGGGVRVGPHDQMLNTTMTTLPVGPRYINYSSGPSAGRSLGNPPPINLSAPPRTIDPPYYHNYDSYWLRGYWGGGMWGWGRWGGDLSIWSFPRWWLGYLYYASGYGLFENPFFSPNADVPEYLEYSSPVQVEGPTDDEGAVDASREQVIRSPTESAGLSEFDAARSAFKAQDYQTALERVEAALKHLPRDASLHEFRALVKFAQGRYSDAAATIYAVLAISPGWNWTTLSNMYSGSEEFTRHLRALETYCKAHLEAADAAFLLAYQYVTCGHYAPAVQQFQTVVRLVPKDELAPHLLTLIEGADDDVPGQSDSAVTRASLKKKVPRSSVAIDQAQIVGAWRAQRGPAITLELTLARDDKFEWKVVGAEDQLQIQGRYYLQGDLLVMEGDGGEPLIGTIALNDGGGFSFRLLGADPADRGLTFSK
ncbi:MAG: tetratricopeptide repeat protein [Planctomycetaceae bacterium]